MSQDQITTTISEGSDKRLRSYQLDSRVNYLIGSQEGFLNKSSGNIYLSTLSPGETANIRLYLSVNNISAINNIKLAITDTGGLSLTPTTFGIATSSEIVSHIDPSQYIIGINTNDRADNIYNIDIPNNNLKDSQYVYLTIKIPQDMDFNPNMISFKWFFDYAGEPSITTFTTTTLPSPSTTTSSTTPTTTTQTTTPITTTSSTTSRTTPTTTTATSTMPANTTTRTITTLPPVANFSIEVYYKNESEFNINGVNMYLISPESGVYKESQDLVIAAVTTSLQSVSYNLKITPASYFKFTSSPYWSQSGTTIKGHKGYHDAFVSGGPWPTQQGGISIPYQGAIQFTISAYDQYNRLMSSKIFSAIYNKIYVG